MAAAETPAELTEKGALTRSEILRVAVERFGRDGFRATSVADIAREADVSGTLAYAYFDNKKALFLAALDSDVADLIQSGVSSVLETPGDDAWRNTLILTLLQALEHHPLAYRVLAGKETDVADRIVELPALEDLRTAVVERIRADRAEGLIRADIDPEPIGGGIVSIFISMLLAAVQFGTEVTIERGLEVLTVVAAAIDPID